MEPNAKVGIAIDAIRKRIKQHREKNGSIGEQNTKAARIDPLLDVLGWDFRRSMRLAPDTSAHALPSTTGRKLAE